MTASTENPCFVLELPLCIDSKGRKRLELAFDFGRRLVNATLGTALGRREQMKQTPEWKAACAMPKGKARTEAFAALSERFHIASANDFEKILKDHAKASGRKEQLNSDIGQVLADNLFRSWKAWLFEGKGKPRFKGIGHGLHSLRGKKASSGIIWKPDIQSVYYAKKDYRVHIPQRDDYARDALRDGDGWRKAKYCAIVRRKIHGKLKYFVQITLAGYPPVKIIPAPVDHRLAVDPSMKNMTLVSCDGAVAKVATSPSVQDRSREIRQTQRAMDRSRRATNPDNYEANGVAKKGARNWVKSKRYVKLQNEVADLQRRKAATRKNCHGRLINLTLQNAGDIRVEKNSWKAMQRGRYGKSVGDGAPSEFVQRLLSKADRAGSKGVEVNPKGIKPTQRDLLTGQCTKHELWERRVRMGESNLFIDRDVAAAVNLLFHSPETGERDAAGMATFLEAVKPCWLDSGVIVEVEAANRLSERELRKILRNGIPSVSVERLDRKKFLSGVCDAESKKALSGASSGSESPPDSETPLL